MRAPLIILFLSSISFSAPTRARLDGVQVDADAVRIETSLPVEHTVVLYTHPDRMVIELQDTLVGPGPSSWPGHGWLIGVRVGQFKTDPPVARVVLDLAGKIKPQLSEEGNALIVTEPETPRAAVPAAPKPEAAAQPEPAREAPQPSPLREPPATVLQPSGRSVFGDINIRVWIPAVGAILAVLLLSALGALVTRRRRLDEVESDLRRTSQITADVEDTFRKELYAMVHRMSGFEERLKELEASRLKSSGPGAGGELGMSAEQLKELRTILRSLSESVQFPRLSR